ncbi:MAG: hypothetical protein JWM94_2786 [Sphingomonas bacterium]|nr:hypothetical protein [Sphingomonas bacterium]
MIRTPTRHAGLVPASTVQQAMALQVEKWTPAQGRGDEQESVGR